MTEYLLREDVPWLLVGAISVVVVVVAAAGDVFRENASLLLVEAIGRVIVVVVVAVSRLQFPVVGSVLTGQERKQESNKTFKQCNTKNINQREKSLFFKKQGFFQTVSIP